MRVIRTFAIASIFAVALTGCGSKSKATTTTTATNSGKTSTTVASIASGSVDVRTTSLGSILVNSHGMTLYLSDADSSGKSNCTGSCASAWPPLTGAATVGAGADVSKLSTITRSDGSKQLAYNGHPLYTWTGDSKAGDTTGQGTNGFHVVSPAGAKIG